MVEFFNKKEEILEVQLTEYGKYLLSIGKLDPVYYGFYDDEILYNSEYADVLGESQNAIDRRIRYETPNLKVIPTCTSAEERVNRFIENVAGAWEVPLRIPQIIPKLYTRSPLHRKVILLLIL